MRSVGQVLEFKRSGEFSDTGESFTVYTFLGDFPGIPANRTGANPRHAAKGDELWVGSDELSPYELKREGKSIGAPEHWQVQHILPAGERNETDADVAPEEGFLTPFSFNFKGVDVAAWRVEAGAPNEWVKAGDFIFQFDNKMWVKTRGVARPQQLFGGLWDRLVRWNRNRTDPACRAALSVLIEPEASVTVGLATEDVPNTPIRGGDTILSRSFRKAVLPSVRGRLVPLTRDHMEALRECYDKRCGSEEPIEDITPPRYGHGYSASEIVRNRGRWGRGSEWYPRIYVVQGVRPSLRWSVSAQSDVGAIFELLSQVGGRMPPGVTPCQCHVY